MDAPRKLHIVMVPWLAYGHIMPYLRVSIFLALKGHRISLVSTPKNLQKLGRITMPSLITLVELPLPPVDGLPLGAESTSDIPLLQVPFLKKAFDLLQPSFTRFLQASSPVHWIVHDFNSHWLPQLAAQLGINSGFLSVFNANTHAFSGSPEELLAGTRLTPEDFTVVPLWITYPSTVAFKFYELLGHGDYMDSGVSDMERIARVIQGSRFVAMRTCPEFEPEALALLGELYQKPVFPVGLLPAPVNAGESDEEWRALREWLDGKKEKSVVYIAFGTEVILSQDSAHELARGIEKSGLPFIWVVRNRDDPDVFPSGFENRVSGRGLVWTGFAPQVRILGHSAVGGFLTHSGWSSVIEALGLGKPLILFPGASSDQGLVARLLQAKGVGLEIVRDERDGSFASESVAQSIRRVVVEIEGESVRNNACSVRDIFGNVELQNKYLQGLCKMLETEATSTTQTN